MPSVMEVKSVLRVILLPEGLGADSPAPKASLPAVLLTSMAFCFLLFCCLCERSHVKTSLSSLSLYPRPSFVSFTKNQQRQLPFFKPAWLPLLCCYPDASLLQAPAEQFQEAQMPRREIQACLHWLACSLFSSWLNLDSVCALETH